MCFIFKYLRYTFRNNFYLIVGIVFGVALSILALEIFDEGCALDKNLKLAYHGFEEDEESYEPRINLAGKPMKAQKTPQDFVRPRYYSTELGIREKLFVGVLTSPNTFDTFGNAFNKTIHHLVNKVMYFSEAGGNQKRSPTSFNGLVQFSDSRLILKPFHILKYIADNFLDEFDFFYLVNDATFVNGRKLKKTVDGLSISQDVHIGFNIDSHSKFCSLDSGILLSNTIMRTVVKNLDWCVKNAYSESNDANLGRCIVHATDVKCSNTIGKLQYQTHTLINPDLSTDKILKNSAVYDSISIWPVNKPDLFYSLHQHIAKKNIEIVKRDIEKLRRSVLNTTVVLPGNRTEEPHWPIGTPPPTTPGNRFDLLRWDYFNEKQIFLKSDFTNVEELQGADLLDIQNVINETVRHLEHKYEGQIVFKRLVNGYRKFDPARGLDYILDLSCKDTVTGHETHLRFEVCKPLGKVELVPVPYVTENTRINMVVFATASNQEDLLRFINSYASVCMEKKERTSLLLVLVYGADHPGKGAKNDIHQAIKDAALKQSSRFHRDNNKIVWLSVKLPTAPVSDNLLSILLMDLVIKKYSQDNLMLLTTPNSELRQDFLNRVRMNTVKEIQVFSPIPFSEFNPLIVYHEDLLRPKEMDINKNYGHYDITNIEHISFYVRDFKRVRQLTEKQIAIVHVDKDLAASIKGKDVDSLTLYGLFARYGDFHVMRAIEPSLKLRHVELSCGALDTTCHQRRIFNLGPRGQLGQLLLDFKSLKKNHVTIR